MFEAHANTVGEKPQTCGQLGDRAVSVAERELSDFVNSVADLFGPDQTRFLTEIWLDTVASMDRMPGPTSPEWRLVSVAASARLARLLIDLPGPYGLF
jgi:hypothetical protein